MTSPQPLLPGEGNTPPMPTTGPDDNPNIDNLTAVGNTEDALPNANIVPAVPSRIEVQLPTVPVAQMFYLEVVEELQHAENGVAPAEGDIFAPTMVAVPLTPQRLQALAASAEPLPTFNPGFILNQFDQGPFGSVQLGMENSLGQLGQQPFLDPSPYIAEPLNTSISAYAKLEFEDGEFYMSTYGLVLGRDDVLWRQAKRREKRQARLMKSLENDFGQDPRTSKQRKREESRYSKSIVSESGGIMRDGGSDPDPEKRRRKRLAQVNRRKASIMSKSDNCSSHSSSRHASTPQLLERVVYKPRTHLSKSYQYAIPMTDDAVPVDPDSLRPDPWACPLIGIHPNPNKGSGSHKNISREHLKISFNPDSHVFEAFVIGRNGVFHDKDSPAPETMLHHAMGSTITLTSGCYLQIADVRVRFMLPEVRHGDTGADGRDYGEEEEETANRSYSEGGKEMSFDFEHDLRPVPVDSDEDSDEENLSGDDNDPSPGQSFSEEDQMQGELEGEEDDDQGDENDLPGRHQQSLIDYRDQEIKHSTQSPEEILKTSPKVEKKRGPGRPPKDGIMSKREKQLVKKEAMAQAQSGSTAVKSVPPTNTSPDAPVPPVKNKVGRPRKHPLPEVPAEPREKRKYTKRKPKEPKEGVAKQEGSGGDNPATPAKKEKPPKEPQSPPLELNEADYTEEQLKKPNANYVQLIYEALTLHPAGRMTLPQIYKAIERRYPYYHFRVPTTGWQSSVRHNLGQNPAFEKAQKEGKGYKWALTPGATIEKEKKKALPPPQAPPGQMQQIYSNPYHMMPGQPYHPHMMGPQGGYQYGPPPPNMQPNQYSYMSAPPPQMNSQPHHPGPYPQMNGPPPGMPAIMPPQLAAAPSSYSSPYAPKLPSANEPQPNGQGLPTEELRNSNIGPQTFPQGFSQGPSQITSQGLPQGFPQGLSQSPSEGLPPGFPQGPYQGPPSHGHTPQKSIPQGQQPHAPLPQPQAQPQPQVAPQQASQPPPGGDPNLNPPQLNRPEPNDKTKFQVQKFKEIMMESASSRPNVSTIIDAASNQVLGRPDTSDLSESDRKRVKQMKETLISMLKIIPGTNIDELVRSTAPAEQEDQGARQSQVAALDTNQNGTQASAPPQQPTTSTGSDKPALTTMRPQLNGHSHSHPSQNRPNISIPRPPMMGPGSALKRTTSGSPAPWSNAQSGSPAKSIANGASAPVLTAKDNVEHMQIAGQKRTYDEAALDGDDLHEPKRLSTSGPPQVKT